MPPRKRAAAPPKREPTPETPTDPVEPMIHQRGTIPVGLQMCFGINEFAIHHDDVAAARGSAYRPSDEVVDVLIETWKALTGGETPPSGADHWAWILEQSGR